MDTKTIRREIKNLSDKLDSNDVDWQECLNIIWRRKWAILLLTGIVAMLALLVSLNMTPRYEAVSRLLIEEREIETISIDQLYGLESGSDYLETQFELLRSRELAGRVVDQLDLTSHPEFDPRQNSSWVSATVDAVRNFDIRRFLPFTTPSDLEVTSDDEIRNAAISAFMERVTISPILNTQLAEIKVRMADARMASRAANALARSYIESQLEARLEMAQTATDWMNSRLSELRGNLQESERELQRFMEEEELVDLEGVTTVSAGELAQISEKLADARRIRSEAESQYNQIESMKGQGFEQMATVPAIQRDRLVQQFQSRVASSRAKVEELTERYGPRYPTMIEARTELASARENLRGQVQQVVAGIERNYELAVANVQSLESQFEMNKEQIQDISSKQYRLRELQLNVDTNRQLYDTFLTRLKETTATQDFKAANARITDQAIVPNSPVEPNTGLIVLVSAFVALFAGIGASLLVEAADNTMQTVEDVENRLNLAVLGIMPLLKQTREKDIARAFEQDDEFLFSESIRTVRTALVLAGMNSPSKVVLVTSTVPGEGKSMFCANFGQALGQMEKVLLIDADLRRPSLLKYFGFPVGTPGLANLISGTASIEETVRKVGPMDVISAGMVPPNPQELLSSPEFPRIMEELKERYDRIVMDSPPTMAVSDAMLLATHVNKVIYVVQSASTPAASVERGVGQLLQNGAPLSGIVLNKVDLDKAARYGDGYTGYYGHYEYTSEYDEAEPVT